MSSRKAHVIDGEASESESEDDITPEEVSRLQSTKIKPSVIQGEAPESDDDDIPLHNRSVVVENSSDSNSFEQDSPTRSSTRGSLLHQKLYDSNINLRIEIERLLRDQNLLSKLTEADKTLHKDQELLRSASANINISLVKLKNIKNTLHKIDSADILCNIKESKSVIK